MISSQTTHLIADAATRLVNPGVGKFTDEDVSRDARLGDAALDYVSAYTGTFIFLCSLRGQLAEKGRLSTRQLASVINCMVQDITRQVPAEAVSCTPKIPNGIYTVTNIDGSYTTLRLKDTFRDNCVGEQIACFLSGANNGADYTPFAFVQDGKVSLFKRYVGSETLKHALTGLLADAEEAKAMGIAYARASGNCYLCGRTLTTPESLEAGIGPVCAGKSE